MAKRHLDTTDALTVYLILLFGIPGVWVLPGLGAAGRPANLFAIGLLALWVAAKLLPDYQPVRTMIRWPLLINALVILISYGVGQQRGLSGAEALSADRGLLDMAATAGLVLAASEGLPTTAHLERLTKRLVLIAAATTTVAFIQFLLEIDPYSIVRFPLLSLNTDLEALEARGSTSLVRAKGSTLHPIEFGVLMAMVLPLAIHQMLIQTRKSSYRWWVVIVALMSTGSLLTISRSAVLSLATAMAILLWAWSTQLRLRFAAATVLFAVGLRAIIPGLLGTIRSLFTWWSNDPSVEGRTEDYTLVSKYVSERPFFGRGVNTFIPTEYFFLDNAYLMRTLTTGLVGLVALVGLLLTAVCLCRVGIGRHEDQTLRHLSVATIAGIAVAIVSAATFDFFSFPTVSGVLAILVGASGVLAGKDRGVYAPRSVTRPILRPSYQPGYQPTSWWRDVELHQFNRGFGNTAGRSGDPGSVQRGDVDRNRVANRDQTAT